MSKEDESGKETRWLDRYRTPWAVLNGALLAGLAFVLLFTGYIEGGAFVSLLMLALLVGLLTLFGDRVYQVTLFGSEIRLRKIEQDADIALQALHQSRIDNYRMSLRLTVKHGNSAGTGDDRDERAELLIDVLHMIREAELTPELAQDIIDACRTVEASLVERLGRSDASSPLAARASFQETLPYSERILALHDSGGAMEVKGKSGATSTMLEELRELVRLRHQAQLHV